MNKLIQKAVDLHGTVAAFARAIDVEPPTVHQWLTGARPVPAGRCLKIEEATGGAITRYELCPKVFGQQPQPAKAA